MSSLRPPYSPSQLSLRTALILGAILALPLCAHADVKHGEELKRGVNCGIPEGTVLQPSDEKVFDEPIIVSDQLLGAVKTKHTEGVVKFVRCKFINPGFISAAANPDGATPGTQFYTVQRAGTGSVELEDCEVYGGKSIAIMGVDCITRTYVAEGNDLLRPLAGESFYTEVFAEKILMASPESHSDVMQVTFNKVTADDPKVAKINVLRCRFDPRNVFDANEVATQTGNGAIQLGSFSANSGVEGKITNCFFDGGAFTLAGGGIGDLGKPIVLRGNKFGRNCLYGAFNPNWRKNHDVDDSNVWEDTNEPAEGKPNQG